MKKYKTCPVTGKNIARRYPVHSSVFNDCLNKGSVIRNVDRKTKAPTGSLRNFIYVGLSGELAKGL